MIERYKVVDGSQSAHCCFDSTVVDTTKPVMIGGRQYKGQFEAVCECFEPADAETIAAVLNTARRWAAARRACAESGAHDVRTNEAFRTALNELAEAEHALVVAVAGEPA